jgi:hypothetical protein
MCERDVLYTRRKPSFQALLHHAVKQSSIFLKFSTPKCYIHLFELILWPTVNRPIRLSVAHPFGAHNHIFYFFCWANALLLVLGRPLWREDGSVICSAMCRRRTHNRALLSHLRLIRFPFRRLLRLAGITVGVFLPASTRGIHLLSVYVGSSQPPSCYQRCTWVPH